MTEAQIQLQNALTTTFLANLAFLSEYDNKLYHRVDELSRMIGNGTYKEKYALEFIMESGDFDIYDIVNDKYIYKKTPKKINDELVRKIQFDEKNIIYFLEAKYFNYKDKFSLHKENKFSCNSILEFFSLTQNDMFEYANILNDFLENKEKKRLKKIEKFIFLGTLLGRHIPRIAQKVDAESYLVLERNIEIFRLSLFTVDYTILGEKGVVFSIMDNQDEEEKRVFKFLKSSLFGNYMIKFSSTNINIDSYIDTLNTTLHLVNNSSQYTYTRYLYSLMNRVTSVLGHNYKILLMNKVKENLNYFTNLPVLFIAAGPSLDQNIEWIKEKQNYFYIVTIGAAYKKLLNNNIRVDMISTLDEDIIIEELQFDDNSVSKISENTIILASVKTNEKILNKFNREKLFLYEISVAFNKDNIIFEGYSIGELTLDILLKMNTKNIYLIGLDLALNQDTGMSHSHDSSSIVSKHNLNEEQNKEIFSLEEGIIKVKGNFIDEVSTLAMFYNSIRALNDILSEKDTDIKIFNLSESGAYFHNTIPLNKNEISFMNLEKINNNELLDIFNTYSIKELSYESKLVLTKDKENLINFLKKNIHSLKNDNIKNYQEFYSKVLDLFFNIEVHNKLIIVIIQKYLMMLLPYLSYHFNNLKIKKENKKIEEIKKIFIKQMEIIIKDYIICLDRVI